MKNFFKTSLVALAGLTSFCASAETNMIESCYKGKEYLLTKEYKFPMVDDEFDSTVINNIQFIEEDDHCVYQIEYSVDANKMAGTGIFEDMTRSKTLDFIKSGQAEREIARYERRSFRKLLVRKVGIPTSDLHVFKARYIYDFTNTDLKTLTINF